jgi:hypothetical protein
LEEKKNCPVAEKVVILPLSNNLLKQVTDIEVMS